ncbi:hypothetical protein BJX65DRAFT_289652 [Aspergillus insuetus]
MLRIYKDREIIVDRKCRGACRESVILAWMKLPPRSLTDAFAIASTVIGHDRQLLSFNLLFYPIFAPFLPAIRVVGSLVGLQFAGGSPASPAVNSSSRISHRA